MSFDAYLVSFGLARTLIDFGIAPGVAYQLLVATAIVDTSLLWTFFRGRRARRARTLHDPLELRGVTALEGKPPTEILAWAVANLGPRVAFATGFGAEGCVLIDLIARAKLPIELFTLDTGLLFPETYALWAALEAALRRSRSAP